METRAADIRDGAASCFSPALAVFVLAFAMGSIAQAKGWTLVFVVAFCIGVVGASVQAATLQMWPAVDVTTVFLACLAIHSRYVLVCASLEPIFRPLSWNHKLFLAHF